MNAGKAQLFGTMFKPIVRWTCARCAASNSTALMVPLRENEHLHCRKCHRRATVTLDMATVPRVWGGKAETRS